MMMDYSEICREAFALVADIGKGAFNNEFSERGTLATTVEVAMPVLDIFRKLNPHDPDSLAKGRRKLSEIATSEQGVFSQYPTLTTFALGKSITIQ